MLGVQPFLFVPRKIYFLLFAFVCVCVCVCVCDFMCD